MDRKSNTCKAPFSTLNLSKLSPGLILLRNAKIIRVFFFLSPHIFSLEMEGLSDDAIGDIDEVKLANISLS